MVALLDDSTLVYHDNPIRVADRAQAVGDDDGRAPVSKRSIASWISASVTVSMLAVASSRIRIRGSARTARAMQINWRCPTDRLAAAFQDAGLVAIGRAAMKSWALASSAAAARLAHRWLAGLPKRMFSAMRAGEQEGILRNQRRTWRRSELWVTRAHPMPSMRTAPRLTS